MVNNVPYTAAINLCSVEGLVGGTRFASVIGTHDYDMALLCNFG